MKKLATVITLVALLGCQRTVKESSSGGAGERRRPRLPNIVVAFVDVTRFDSFGFANEYGNTPFLSKLASSATFFPNAVTPDTWTPTSHSAFFANRTAVYFEHPLRPYFGMAMFLRSLGYDTLLMADNSHLMPILNFMDGFESVQLLKAQDAIDDERALDFYPRKQAAHKFGTVQKRNSPRYVSGWKKLTSRFRDRKPEDIRWVPLQQYFPREEYFAWRYRALKEHLTDQKASPFYLFVNVQGWIPELKYPEAVKAWFRDFCVQNFEEVPSDEEMEVFGRFFLDFGLFFKDPPKGVHMPETLGIIQARLYAEFCDLILEDLNTLLRGTGHLSENDILIIATDHGHSWREHGFRFYAHGEESRTYEELIRSPLLVQAPRFLKSGIHQTRVSLMDIYPTVVSWITDPRPYSDLFNPCYSTPLRKRIEEQIPVCLRTTMGTELVYKENLKFFRNEKLNEQYLFDLERDPGENRNLAHDKSRVEQLQHMMELCTSRSREEERISGPVGQFAARFAEGNEGLPKPEDLDENRAALRALGYVQ